MTLYLFTKDEPGVSNCYNQCAEHWPPLLAEGDTIAGCRFGRFPTRHDRAHRRHDQVTYNGWPLYYWYKDTAPGDTTGQDVGDVWFVRHPGG